MNKKNTNHLKALLSIILILTLITGLPSTKVLADVSTLSITAQTNASTNNIDVTIANSDNEQGFNYLLYSKCNSDTTFKFNPNKSDIKVLQVYPDQVTLNYGDPTPTTTFTSAYDGKSYTTPASALLKMWMEQANAEDSKGYGRGHIHVDTVSLTTFNTDPEPILKNLSDGTYKYDVVYFGAWNGNAGQDLSSQALNSLGYYNGQGYGILLGFQTEGLPNFSQISEPYGNMYTAKSGFTGNHESMGQTAIVRKNGVITNNLWNLDSMGSIPVEVTKSYSLACGNVWLSFAGCEVNDDVGQAGRYGSTNYYLTSWNNIGLIQTGYNLGKATTGEQKIIANTLFYLTQITGRVYWWDSGKDINAPSTPTVSSVTHTSDFSQFTVNYSAETDNGTNYQYYAEATGMDGTSYTSPTVSASVTSGLKGYSIVVDNNASTVPSTSITTTSTSYTFAKPAYPKFYVHVAAVDKTGNISKAATYCVNRLVSITHPINVNYSINPNCSTPFVATDLPITNNSDIPVKVSIQSLFSSSGGSVKFNDVSPSKYNDWSKLTAVQTMSDMALGLKVKENVTGAMSWSTINQSGTLYAAEITGKQLLGTLNSGAKGTLALAAKHGLVWDKSATGQHQLTLMFEAD